MPESPEIFTSERCGVMKIGKTGFACLAAFIIGAVAAGPTAGQQVTLDAQGNPAQATISLPYGFYNEKFGFAAGYVDGRIGYPQPQSALIGTVMAGTEGSAMGVFIG